jgi:hypothetical protein
MSPLVPINLTTRQPFCGSQAACITRDALLRFSQADAISTAPLVDSLHMTSFRPKSAICDLSKPDHNILPLPVLSSSSRSRLFADLASRIQKELRHSPAFLFPFIYAGVASGSEYQAFWLTLYFGLNLALTLYNKVLLESFPYPYTLTAIHALFGLAGGTYLRLRNVYQPKSLCGPDYVVLVAFSVLYSVNIAISNASLDLVTVPVSQFLSLYQRATQQPKVPSDCPCRNAILYDTLFLVSFQYPFQSLSNLFNSHCNLWSWTIHLWRLLLHYLGFHPHTCWYSPGCSQDDHDA